MSTPRTRPPAADRRTLIADTAIDLVAAAGLRGLTHRAVDGAAGLPAGSTSYYFRTRTALIAACYQRLAELDLGDLGDVGDLAGLGDAGRPGGGGPGAGGPDAGGAAEGPPVSPAADRDTAAAALAGLLHRWLTAGRARQLARFELSLEAARNPDLEADFHRAGQGARARASGILAALGARRPEEAAELLVAWTDGLLYDRLAGALARSRPAPDLAELTSVTRRMLDAVLAHPA
ncbi:MULTISPECIES: TetR/AcrR family transcriptional regulator [Streptomyces]|uniref:TetR/AcrR family transcriptional regulator n=1 Tax=Streptomyces TaxID=1883 RepID=UPI00207A1AD7|nr:MULTISPECIES: TetR/AcrR family transcriptional regulator [Streptomyces]MCM9077741.1 TetR family transcriptional regulator [Streptomyces spororaveus]MCX5307779.1 TetR family transcriptional regulator [Streptomyces sp. NBC_00160]